MGSGDSWAERFDADQRAQLRREVKYLVTATELARIFGVGNTAVCNWRKRHADFPKPVIDRSRLTLWDYREVIAWYNDPDRLSTTHRSTRGKTHVEIYGPAAAELRRSQIAAVRARAKAQGRRGFA